MTETFLRHNYFVNEIDRESKNYNHLKYHVILDVSKYQDVVSANAFFNSPTGPISRNWSADRIFVGKRPHDVFISQYFKDVPIIEHKTIWDFYRYIGYDHKKNKYLTPSKI